MKWFHQMPAATQVHFMLISYSVHRSVFMTVRTICQTLVSWEAVCMCVCVCVVFTEHNFEEKSPRSAKQNWENPHLENKIASKEAVEINSIEPRWWTQIFPHETRFAWHSWHGKPQMRMRSWTPTNKLRLGDLISAHFSLLCFRSRLNPI